MKVRITKGGYGYVVGGKKNPTLATRGTLVIVTSEEAERLVDLGVAEYVVEPNNTLSDTGIINNVEGVNALEGANNTEDEDLINDCDGGEDEDDNTEDTLELSEEGLNKLTIAELTNLAKDMEIEVSKCKLKSDFVKAILTAIENGAIPEIAPPIIPE